MTSDFRDQLYANLNLKETSELLAIRRENDRTAWSDDAFNVIDEILQERLNRVPAQESVRKIPLQTPVRQFSLKKVTAGGHLVFGLVCLLAALALTYIFTYVPEAAELVDRELNRPRKQRDGMLELVVMFIVLLGAVGIRELFRAWQESIKETRLARRKRRREARRRR